ncbi:MAG: enoyl-CoA hydratase-related protein [Rhodobacteraceae bacterium]|nr:enoyl-CoA hydratase-related protein [Paracoccaceae bacterium]
MTTRSIETGTPDLLCHISGHAAVLTLNRPDRRNAFSPAMTDALARMLAQTEADDGVRVLVLTGAGRAFCAGGDLEGMGESIGAAADMPTPDLIRRLQRAQEAVSLALYDYAKPTIAVLPGHAAGAGMALALACDLRIAADTAALVPAFGAVGVSGDFGGSWYLSRLIGPARAKEVYFTGRRIAADEALALGLLNRAVPPEDLAEATKQMADAIAAQAPLALRAMKENHNRAVVSDLRSTMAMEADRMVRCMLTEDHQAATRAFLEKRQPEFKGR